jgi:ABC-type antimicrobial peptide transport system permease subunit
MRLLIMGILLGSFALFAAVRLVQGMLYGVSPYDPATLAIAAALLTAVAMFAAFVPARRAASVDPMQALRTE